MAVARQSHMVVMPAGFLVLRVFQMIFAFIVLGICIYGAIYLPTAGIILNIFTSAATVITLIYIFIGTYGQPAIYQYWAIMSLEIFCLLFWLISFALLASEVAIGAAVTCTSSYYDYYDGYYSDSCTTADVFVIGLFGGCAGAGGIEFIFFIISLSMFGVAMGKHRRAGGHCSQGSVATPAQPYDANQNVGAEKANMRPQTQVYPVQGGYYVPANPNGQPFQQMPMQMPPQMYQQMPQQMPQQFHQQLPQQMPPQMPAQLSSQSSPQGSPHPYPQTTVPLQYEQQQVIPQ